MITEDPKVTIRQGSDVETLFDFTKDKITGIVRQPDFGA
jgi:selenophosphate synthetase-related protein